MNHIWGIEVSLDGVRWNLYAARPTRADARECKRHLWSIWTHSRIVKFVRAS